MECSAQEYTNLFFAFNLFLLHTNEANYRTDI